MTAYEEALIGLGLNVLFGLTVGIAVGFLYITWYIKNKWDPHDLREF
jgi:hypothetical protein